MRALALFLLMLPGLVFGQPLPMLALPPPEAFPGMEGKTVVAPWHVERGQVGWHAWFYSGVDNKVWSPGISCPHANGGCDSWETLATKMRKLWEATDRVAAFRSAYQQAVQFDCTRAVRAEQSERGALCRERKDYVSAAVPTGYVATKDSDPIGPPASAWKVKALTGSTTRPARELKAGVLGTREVARATIGAACNTLRPTYPSVNGDLWAEFGPTNVAGHVALCAKQ